VVFTVLVYVFGARARRAAPAGAEPHEVFEVHWIPCAQALAQARSGEITDAKSVAGLFRAREWCKGK
ncbi:MAG: NUDIX hydrolase, partial [Pseudomonadota bacterium]